MADKKIEDTNQAAKQNDANGPIVFRKTGLECGDENIITIHRPSVIIDSHMHIQSGNSATLPFLWGATPVIGVLKRKRAFIEGAGKAVGHAVDIAMLKPVVGKIRKAVGAQPNEDGGYYRKNALLKAVPQQEKQTDIIGDDFVVKMNQAYALMKQDQQYKGLSHLVFLSVVMTMDMEYAHVNGYFGIKVYNGVYATADISKKPVHYWYPRHGFWQQRGEAYERTDTRHPHLPEKGFLKPEYEQYKETVKAEGIIGRYYDKGHVKHIKVKALPCQVDDTETDLYEPWVKQLKYTELAALKYPLKLLPMFHYDPRRWQFKGNAVPFSMVEGASQEGELGGLCLGFKMYTAQGYRPWDVKRLPILKDFYAECCRKRIPVLNHCTPAGAPTFDQDEYYYFTHPNDTDEDSLRKEAVSQKVKASHPQIALQENHGFPPDYSQEIAQTYFHEQFVAPDAWRQVLDKYENLHLCLAHFGGNTELGREWGMQIVELMKTFPNVYADISSSFANKKFRKYFINDVLKGPDAGRIKDRILFGTDWYLTLLDGVNYVEFCQKAKEELDASDTSLWPRFTMHNPYRFYRLGDDDQIGRIAESIIARRKTKEIRDELGRIKQKRIYGIRKEAAWIRQVNNPYVVFEEEICNS
jgi:predicted TIM-barrel fold metal-dependent hydrolase